MRIALLLAALLLHLPSFAQPGAMRTPMVPQSVEMHMQQVRTLEQREAIAAKQADVATSPPAAPKNAATQKLKKKAAERTATGVERLS